MPQIPGIDGSAHQVADRGGRRASIGFVLQRAGHPQRLTQILLVQSVHKPVLIYVPVESLRDHHRLIPEPAQSRFHHRDPEDLRCAHRGVLHHIAVLKGRDADLEDMCAGCAAGGGLP